MKNPFRPTEKYTMSIFAITAVSSFIGIAVLELIDTNVNIDGYRSQFIVASFGSTAVLIYGAPKAAFSKPKNVFFGHMFSAILSLAVVCLFDAAGLLKDLDWMVCGLCVSGSILLMMLTGVIHPPAGATALTIAISEITDYQFLVFPLLIGLLFMMAVAYAAVYLRDRAAARWDPDGEH